MMKDALRRNENDEIALKSDESFSGKDQNLRVREDKSAIQNKHTCEAGRADAQNSNYPRGTQKHLTP